MGARVNSGVAGEFSVQGKGKKTREDHDLLPVKKRKAAELSYE